MKKRSFAGMLITVYVLLISGCQKAPLVDDVSPTTQGPERNGEAAQKAVSFSENFQFPVDFSAFSQCAGEVLQFTGYFHWNSHTTLDAQGGLHSIFTANDHNMSGVGLTSGIKYRQVGATTEIFNIRGTAPQEGTITVTLNYIGQGPNNNAINRFQYHYTINANGTVTIEFVNATTILCQ